MEWSFDIHNVAAADLPALCFALIMSHESVQTMLPPPSRAVLWRYTRAVAAHYLSNPFHSFRHAADVTHGDDISLRGWRNAGIQACNKDPNGARTPALLCLVLS